MGHTSTSVISIQFDCFTHTGMSAVCRCVWCVRDQRVQQMLAVVEYSFAFKIFVYSSSGNCGRAKVPASSPSCIISIIKQRHDSQSWISREAHCPHSRAAGERRLHWTWKQSCPVRHTSSHSYTPRVPTGPGRCSRLG